MKTCKEKALEWGISSRTVTYLCAKGKINGAVKNGGRWMIPDDAVRPSDNRISSGKYTKKSKNILPKSLPLGISDFARIVSEYYYVDKTMLIKDFLDKRPLVSLFTRPRRFGKTLNMDMLRVFFEKTDQDNSGYFKNTNIWKCGPQYRAYQGKYPVIFLTFKDVKYDTWEATFAKIREIVQIEFARHSKKLQIEQLLLSDRQYYERMLDGDVSEVELSSSLERLSRILHDQYKVAPIIIIDEYDTPIQEGYAEHYYDKIIHFMRNFFSGAFKDNQNLTFGFLTGIMKISQESIFSGLNNLSVHSIMDKEYAQYFGFTHKEVHDMLRHFNVSDKIDELTDWYDGYLFGETQIYNPWSVISYISKECTPQTYWANTGKNDIIKNVLSEASDEIKENLTALLNQQKIIASIHQNLVYRDLIKDPGNIYSLLLMSGYLKCHEKEISSDGTYLCSLSIPNKEISMIYGREIQSYLIETGAFSRSAASQIAIGLSTRNFKKLQEAISEYMLQTISFFDGGAEGFYHGMMIGLVAIMNGMYRIQSNREVGYGRYDIHLFPLKKEFPGIIMEFKWKSNLNEESLNKLAKEALVQIDDNHYDIDMLKEGVSDIIKLGIAFSGKNIKILPNC